ncbi:hypothetical protein ACN9J3_06310 [Aliarcobacter butzleri]|uniref:hypothetical protein n=1 Tax=Aliarcobacter butzleri TaxID=28197 RepID=UPI003B21BB9B
MPRTINIKTVDDLKIVEEAILNNEDFKLGTIEPVKYKLVLDGGRFKDFNPSLINIDIAKIIISIQTNYDKIIEELESKYNIKIDKELRKLNFKIEKGSGIIETLLEASGVIKKMESKDLMIVLIVAIVSFSSYEAYSKYTEKLQSEIVANKEIKLKELEKEDRQEERKTTKEYFDGLLEVTKELAANKEIHNAVNKPKREILSILNDEEYIKVSETEKIKPGDKSKYNYKAPQIEVIEDIEDIQTETHIIETYNFIKPGKLFKFEGVVTPANSEILPPAKRIKLMQKADIKQEVKVELKYIKDPTTNKVKSIYILDYIEN